MTRCKASALALLLACSTLAFAEERLAVNTIELQSTFKGNQEQPKVLYIVPWKKIEAPAAAYRPLESLIENNFRYLDREEFRRNVAYRSSVDELNPSREVNSPAE